MRKRREDGILTQTRCEMRNVGTDDRDSDFECYNNSDGKPVRVGFGK